jgi:Immunoglobulin domain/Immunoglobulin I-set domain
MALTERENWIYAQVVSGNVPNFLRALVPVSVSATISGTSHTATYYAASDYLAIGTDADYFLEPTTPLLAQRLCNALGYTLPTRKMVNQLWTNAALKVNPLSIPWSPQMITVPVFAEENFMVRTQRNVFTNSFPLGALVSGDKKDVVISRMIYTNFNQTTGVTDPVVIYGWHQISPPSQYGLPIQPLYNGHEETYADYSHGIRLVQNTLTVDGSPNTITNVLTNPALAAVLSDEGPNEGTTSDGVIRVPHYAISALAPVIINQPRSQTVVPGASLPYRVLIAGDPPLSYRWQFNGTPLPGATNASLLVSNAQTANAGSYSVIVTNGAGSVTSRPALLRVNTNVHPVLFADSFDTDTSANWNLFWGAANGIADYTADWAFDYGATPYTFNGVTGLIPPAPNSPDGSTHGVRFIANNNDTNAFTAAVNIYPKGQSFSGNFALKFDLWLNYPGGAGGINSTGSTEFAICGIDHLGTQVNWVPASASSSDGIWFAVDGEGGTSEDYRAYLGNLSGTQIDLTAAGTSGLTASNNTAPIYQNLFPTSRFETAGAPGKDWIEVELRQTNNIILWVLDGTVVAQRTNTSAFTSGNIMIGYMDPFPSIANPAEDAFVLFDNVRVEDLSAAALQPPAITSQPANQTVSAGSNVTFTVGASGSNPLGYQWRFNGTNLAGATTLSFSLTNVQTASAGAYDVVISNAAGLAASAPATLAVSLPEVRFLSVAMLANGQVQLLFSAVPGQDYVIQASTNLTDWRPISVLTASNGPLPFLDPDAANFACRFYRARQGTSQTLADFEAFAPGAQVMFLSPGSSGSTASFLNPTPNFACVTNTFPPGHSSARVLATGWSFKTGTTNPWLRFTTFNALNIPNPTISTNQALQFDMYTDNALYVEIGFRETSTTAAIGADGGTSGTIEWIGGTTDNTVSPPKGHFVPAGQWTTLEFFLPYEPVRGFTGDGVLESSTGKGVFEHLELVPAAGPGTYNIYLDNFRVTDLAP